MKLLIFLIILPGLFTSGCATKVLQESNEQFNKQKQYYVYDKEIKSIIYADKNSKYYEIELNGENLFVTVQNDKLYLVNNAPSGKLQIGEATIYIITEEKFSKSSIELNNNSYPNKIYAVVPRNQNYLSTTGNYKIYYSSNGQTFERGPVINNLTPSVATKVESNLRNAGYLLTVPLDILTAPLFIGIIAVQIPGS